MSDPAEKKKTNFIRMIIDDDLKTEKYEGRVHTRFPPEPNGYLHIGHAKSICLNFGLARDYSGLCNLRFDDTNPAKEEEEYVNSIIEDVKWLGFDWDDRLFFASDYFDRMYDYAEELIKRGKAYVCDLSGDEIKEYRGTLTEPGKNSPHRDRSAEENLDLFRRMRDGEYENGEKVLRAKIDMASPNINMRDPIIYRILHAPHHNTGDTWCIYPMYDYAHCLEDSIEHITHSICTLEFEDHRPLYDWFLDSLEAYHPQQIEFAPLNVSYTVLSKRKLLQLVKEGEVSGWDDPRMPTISGMRRRGYTSKAIQEFCDKIGVAKRDSMVDVALLEHCIREDLNYTAQRYMAVLDPVRLVIENYPSDKEEMLDAVNNPEDPDAGTRQIPFCRELYIERDDFREDPPGKYHRLSPGKEVRLRYGYYVTCTGFIRNKKTGRIDEVRCTYDPATRGGDSPDGRRVKGTIHWVSARHCINGQVKLYDRLFNVPNPLENREVDFKEFLNPDSLVVLDSCKLESALAEKKPGERMQFERKGYFCVDKDSEIDALVFNRTVPLKDTWAKVEKAQKRAAREQSKKNKSEKEQKHITYDDFAKLDLRVGIIREASLVEGADKLLNLKIDIGEKENRNVFAGIKKSYPDPAVLKGKRVVVVANLKPRKMSFGVSEAMILCGSSGGDLSIATFEGKPEPGSKVS